VAHLDIIARLLSQKLSENLGKSFIVENKPGGSANIGIAQVAKSPADGSHLLLVSSSFAVNPISSVIQALMSLKILQR
jgi:tripartite-type tricarboxylate transporter receptor subunit TctC